MTRVTVLGIAAMTIPGSALGSGVVYGYDTVGRVTSALYDNGTCLAYAYDANGNLISDGSTSFGYLWYMLETLEDAQSWLRTTCKKRGIQLPAG